MAAPMEAPVRKEDKCGLCGLGYGDLDVANGSDEISVLLPCGHVYGNICIQARRQARNYSQACPGCQKSLLYQGCGHEVKVLHVTAAQRHEGVRGEGVPYRCTEVYIITLPNLNSSNNSVSEQLCTDGATVRHKGLRSTKPTTAIIGWLGQRQGAL
jgi:hypothetical protein